MKNSRVHINSIDNRPRVEITTAHGQSLTKSLKNAMVRRPSSIHEKHRRKPLGDVFIANEKAIADFCCGKKPEDKLITLVRAFNRPKSK